MSKAHRRQWSRRGLLGAFGAVLAVGAACAPSAPAPTPAPPSKAAPTVSSPAPTAAVKPTTAAAPTPAPKPASPTAAPAKPKALAKVRLGLIPNIFDNAFDVLGVKQGYYRDEGIDLEYKEVSGGPANIRAMVADELDSANIGITPVLPAIYQGAPLRIVGASKPKLNLLLYSKKEINRLEDLQGRTIGTDQPGAATTATLMAYFTAKQIDPSKYTNTAIGSAPAIFAALVAGKVDAGVAGFEFTAVLKNNPDLKVLINFGEELPSFQRNAIVVHERLLRQPDALLGFLTGLARSVRYAIENKDAVVRFGIDEYKRDRDELEYGHEYDVKNRLVSPDLDYDARAIEFMQRLNVESGQQPEVMPFDRVATLEFQQKVVAKIGKYQWKS